MIVCTDGPTTLEVTLSDGLKSDRVHVWQSDASEQFVEQADIAPVRRRLHGRPGGQFDLFADDHDRPAQGRSPRTRFPPQSRSRCPTATISSRTSRARRRGISPIRKAPSRSGTSRATASASSRSCPQQGILWVYAEDRQAVYGDRRPEMVGLCLGGRRAHRRRRRGAGRPVRRPESALLPLDTGQGRRLEAQLSGEDAGLGHDRQSSTPRRGMP